MLKDILRVYEQEEYGVSVEDQVNSIVKTLDSDTLKNKFIFIDMIGEKEDNEVHLYDLDVEGSMYVLFEELDFEIFNYVRENYQKFLGLLKNKTYEVIFHEGEYKIDNMDFLSENLKITFKFDDFTYIPQSDVITPKLKVLKVEALRK